MEKLLKLLKEYAPDYCKDYPDDIIMDEIVISKRFGFIKRLDYHDKIDYKKLDKIKSWQTLDECSINNEIYEDLLMLLSIQDKPIEFLISILKRWH